jgi:isoaspartyl peptidase/L-asparaginase-like protein (Ntn-hydrolase superfamily)
LVTRLAATERISAPNKEIPVKVSERHETVGVIAMTGRGRELEACTTGSG